MIKNCKKLLAALLVSAMILTMSACKKDRNPVDDDSSSSQDVSSTDTEVGKVSGSISYDDMIKKIDDAKKVNENTVAWLTIPGTNIDYPILHNGNEDNDYYIDRNLKGDVTGSSYKSWEDTVVYAHCQTNFDSDMNFSSSNFVLFGHNWNNISSPLAIGNDPEYTMFAQLPSYTDQEFLEQNPYIYFSTSDNEMVWKVYAAFYCEEDWTSDVGFNYIDPNLNQIQMSNLLVSQMDRSLYFTDVDVNSNDKILTLSTCSRVIEGAGEKQRFVVVARLLRDGESDKDPIQVNPNPNPRAPML